MNKYTAVSLALWSVSACATSFTGSAHIEGGRSGCQTKCSAQGLEMSALVYLGEYSSACVCSVQPPAGAPAVSQRDIQSSGVAAAAGATSGVVMQKQEREIIEQSSMAY
jgi:hypothetical protein